MKRILWLALGVAFAGAALAADVRVSAGGPGFYGQIDVGGYPSPPVIYPQPVVVAPAPEYAQAPPVYLHVPPGHEKHWKKHCAEYHACGRPVYFVRDDWYNKEYVHGHDHDHDHDHDHGRN